MGRFKEKKLEEYEEELLDEDVTEELNFDGKCDRDEWLEELEEDYHKNGKPLPDMDAW